MGIKEVFGGKKNSTKAKITAILLFLFYSYGNHCRCFKNQLKRQSCNCQLTEWIFSRADKTANRLSVVYCTKKNTYFSTPVLIDKNLNWFLIE